MEAARHILPEIPDIVLDFPRRRVAAKTAIQPRFAFGKLIAIMLLLGLAAFANVCQKALIAQNGIDISRLENQIRLDERIGKGLKVDRVLLQSPARLERLAVNRLEMAMPETIHYITVPAEIAKPRVETRGAGIAPNATPQPAVLGKIMTKVSLLVR